MVKVVWTDQAIDDLDDIARFIAENSERFASITVRKLVERTDVLRSFPLSGRIVPEKGEEQLRELIDGNYRIIYEITSREIVHVLAVYHSSRELKP